jgi:superfamily II DNA or RNA helicase
MLFAIKVLDEGVNVPMAQNAIFLASGKNYREFVQRRGRILRKYKTEEYEKSQANIFDIVVLPTLKQYNSNKTTAKKLIIAEFRRLFEFYKMSIPNEATFWKIENELKKFGLTQYYIENLIENE